MDKKPNENKIKCPKCGEYFEPSEAFRSQFEDQIKNEYDEKLKNEVKIAEEKAIKELEDKPQQDRATANDIQRII